MTEEHRQFLGALAKRHESQGEIYAGLCVRPDFRPYEGLDVSQAYLAAAANSFAVAAGLRALAERD